MGLFDILASIGTMASPVPKKSTIQATPPKPNQVQKPSVSGNDNWLQDSLDYYGYDPRKIDPISQAEEKDRVAGLLSEDLEGFSGATKSGKKARKDFEAWDNPDPFATGPSAAAIEDMERQKQFNEELALHKGEEGYNQGSDAMKEALAEPGRGLLYAMGINFSDAGPGVNQGSDALKDAMSSRVPLRTLEENFTSYDDIYTRDGGSKNQSEEKGSLSQDSLDSLANQGKQLTEGFNTAINNASTPNSSSSFNSRPLLTQMEEWYDFLENTDEGRAIAEANPLLADRDNYGYSALRASKDSDLLAQWALADPRFMDRLRASGVNVDDVENLSNNIYDYMWGDNVIDVVKAMQGNGDYTYGVDSDAITDLGGYLNSKYNFGFDPDEMNRLGLDNDDIATFLLLNQVGNKGWGDLNIDMVDDLLHRAGYLDQDSHIRWGSNKDSAWNNTQGMRDNARRYTDISDETYSSDIAGQFDSNVIGSLMALEELGNQGKLDANGNPYQRRIILDSSPALTNKSTNQKYKNSSSNESDIQASLSALGLV